jgi:hypothetical protein
MIEALAMPAILLALAISGAVTVAASGRAARAARPQRDEMQQLLTLLCEQLPLQQDETPPRTVINLTAEQSHEVSKPMLTAGCQPRAQATPSGLHSLPSVRSSIAPNQRDAKRRECSATAVLAALPRFDRRTSANAIDFIYQEPRPPVGHLHRPTPGGDRPARMDVFKQFDFAVSDVPMRVQIDAKAQGRKRPQ